MADIKHWLIVYDIRNVKRLAKVEKCVESYAWRVQKSVFESNATENTIEQLQSRLEGIIEKTEDFVLFFKLCERDWQKQEKYGINAKLKEEIPDEGFAIL
jgi:CRISPR-associated protein Cas2